jgi:hypothetical protein
MLYKICLVARELASATLHAVLVSVSAVPASYGSSTMLRFSRAAVMQCAPREENFELVRQPHLRTPWPESSAGARERTLGCNSLPFAVHCRGVFKHTESCARHRELDVVRPRLFKSSTSAPPLALFRFHYPRAYLTTSARPHTALDFLDRYQTLSNPQTNAIHSRPGPAAVHPSARLADTEPPAARNACSLSRLSHFLALLCPSIRSEGYGGRRWEIIA